LVRARARLLALDAPAGVAALAGAESAADALAVLPRLRRLEIREAELLLGHELGLLDLYEVTDLPQHAGEHRTLLLLDGTADLAEAERAQRAAVALALADLAPHLGDPHLRHLLVVLLLAQAASLRLLLGLWNSLRLFHGGFVR